MATFRKVGQRWRAEVRRQGHYASETFATKAAAVAWATREEADIEARRIGRGTSHTMRHVLERYRDERSAAKRGVRWEVLRIDKWIAEWRAVDRPASSLTARDLADWRDARLRSVSAATVRREMNLMGAILTVARKEWHYLAHDPMAEVRRPADSAPRERRVSQAERDALQAAALLAPGAKPANARQRVAVAIEIAIETGMRAGEILSLTAASVDLEARVARLARTKNGDAREVPLSTRAVSLLRLLLPATGTLVGLSAPAFDVHFRRLREIAAADLPGIASLHFHDTRHEACTQLAKRLTLLDLARVIGHRDPRNLLRYYNPTSSEIAERLG